MDISTGWARDVELLFELGTLRHVERTWKQFGGVPYANVAEHSFRVAFIGWSLAAREGADPGKVVMMALLHDVPESRTGDVNYLSRMYTSRNEELALADQFRDTSLCPAVPSLWHEYEARESLEAKIVKDADTLDCDFELRETSAVGCSLLEALRGTRDAVRDLLYTASARACFDRLYAADPHDWHVLGRNRHTLGDWSEAAALQ